MEYGRCKTKYARVSPRKARLDAALMKGKSVEEATLQLSATGRKGALPLKKALDSAVANAELQHDVSRENLVVIEVRVDPGPTLKRAKARARGARSPILKRTSHLTVVVGSQQGAM